MKFSVGDRVLLKRTGEEGFIITFLSKQMVEVEVGDTRFPVYADELEHPYLKWFTDPKAPKPHKGEKTIAVEKAASRPARLSRGIYLSFLPQFVAGAPDDIVEAFRIHFLNETADHLTFSYLARTAGGETLLELNGSLHPFGNIFLHTLSLEAINAQPRFQWTIAPKEKPSAGVSDVLRIRPAQLVRYLDSVLREGEPSFSVLLSSDAEAVPSKVDILSKPEISPQVKAESTLQLLTEASAILDLHMADADVVGAEGATQILSMQIALLQRELNAAFAAGMDRMVVIHGIGSGALRDAVHQELRDTPYVEHFINQWMGAYGWGATEVFFTPK